MDQYSFLSISNSPETGPLDLFMAGTDEVYVITPAARGWRFSRVTRRGTVSITVAAGRILPGARILDALRIAAACPGGGADFFKALAAAEISTTPLRAQDWMIPSEAQIAEGAGTAVRSFLSGRDIERMLSFPFQPTSVPFARTVLAPATAALRQAVEDDPGVVRLSMPIEQRYAVIYPDGVRPSSRSVERGEILTLTYYAEGRHDATHSLTAGNPSPFVEYDGAAINVRPLKALGIELDPVNPPAPEQPATAEAPKPAAPALAPGERIVGLRLRFSDDRLVKTTMNVTDDSPEYRLLRAGMFHGYRARRLAVKNHHEENYLIDLRTDDESPAGADTTAAPAPLAAMGAAPASNPDGSAAPRRRKRRRGPGPWVTLILIILAIALGIVAVSYLPGLFSHVDNYSTELATSDSPSDSLPAPALIPADSLADSEDEPLVTLADTAAAGPAPQTETIAPAATPADDYAYLNRATVWHRDSLATPEGLAVFDSFATGRLGEIPAQDFFAAGRCTNPRVNQVIKLIWAAHKSSTQTSNERILKRLEGSATIDFNELFKSLAGVQSAKPNKLPLPSTASR